MEEEHRYEFHSYFGMAHRDPITQAFAIPYLAGEVPDPPPSWQELRLLRDSMSRVAALSQAMITPQAIRARDGIRTTSTGYRLWVQQEAAPLLADRTAMMQQLGLLPTLPDLNLLPAGSWGIRMDFVLQTPYLSRDDRPFHITDHPVRKEWVFDVPCIAASMWKGVLRDAMRQARGYCSYQQEQSDPQLMRLFGSASPGQAGTLRFFPTYFDRLGLVRFSPHNRRIGVPEGNGIVMECAPQGSRGSVMILHVPRDHTTSHHDDDIPAVLDGLVAVLREHGIGAKKSLGFGMAEDHGDLEVRISTRTFTRANMKLGEMAETVGQWLRQEDH